MTTTRSLPSWSAPDLTAGLASKMGSTAWKNYARGEFSPRQNDRLLVVSSVLEFGIAGRSGERNHVADVGHARDELDDAFQSQPESGMRHGAEPAQIQIPPVVVRDQVLLLHAVCQARPAALHAGCRR